eukprot:gene15505-18416_t
MEADRTGKSVQQYQTFYAQAKKSAHQQSEKLKYERETEELMHMKSTNPNIGQLSLQDRERMLKVHRMNQENSRILKQTHEQVLENQKTMQASLNTMATQREQLGRIDRKFDNIDAHLDVASKLIKKMS